MLINAGSVVVGLLVEVSGFGLCCSQRMEMGNITTRESIRMNRIILRL